MQNAKKTRILLSLLFLAATLAAAGCGGGGSNGGGNGGGPTPNPTPSLAAIAPKSTPAGALAFTLTVTGSNFINASTVEWNGSNRATTFVSGTQLTAKITVADLGSAGTVTVTVVNPAPGGGTSRGANFTIAPDTIAYESSRAFDGSNASDMNSINNIWVMNPDGSNPKALTKLTAVSVSSNLPVWSPDGSKIVFSSNRALDGSDALDTNGTSNIWVINADGSNPKALTQLTAVNASSAEPVWSPDGSKIAFNSERALDGSDALNTNGTFNIWVINADGSNPTPLTKLTAMSAGSFIPVWSPDGSKIAFFSTRALNGSDAVNTNGTLNIWVMNADGSNPTPLTKLTALGAGVFTPIGPVPIWSPDGSKIVFSSSGALDGSDAANTALNIWVINADGSGAAHLTNLTKANSAHPVWSPDGSKILFHSQRALDGSDAINTTLNIWVVNADGSGAAHLTGLTAAVSEFPRQP